MMRALRQRRFVRARVTLAAATLLAMACGCADPALWPRWVAERDFWHARKHFERIRVNPSLAKDADYARASASFASIARRFPAAVWAQHTAPGPARDVAAASGRSAIAVARIDEMRGRAEVALAEFAAAERDWRPITEVALEAAVGRAELFERMGRVPDALSAWEAVATDYPLVDDLRGDVHQPVLDAPLRVAEELTLEGHAAAADTVLAIAERRTGDELARRRGGALAPALCTQLSELRARRGNVDGAMSALREALDEPAARKLRPQIVLTLADRALAAGRADTALVYAAWADTGFAGVVRADAMMIAAQAWEMSGVPDSALAVYQRFLDRYPQTQDSGARARFQRAVILERLGRWEQALTEYRALVSSQPSHPLAFASLLRIVNHHASRGEDDLARLEGRQAVETIDQIILGQHDPGVLLDARMTRAEIQAVLRMTADAIEGFAEAWTLNTTQPAAATAGLRAAALAESVMHDDAKARELYQDVAARAALTADRERARQADVRLSGRKR
jgi:tetratricopeptide (TPR) repeat protein